MKNEIFPVNVMSKTCEELYFSFPLKIFVLSVIMFLSFIEMVMLSLAALCFILGDGIEVTGKIISGLDIPGKVSMAKAWCVSALRDFIVTMRIILIAFKAWSDDSWAFRAEIIAADKYIED